MKTTLRNMTEHSVLLGLPGQEQTLCQNQGNVDETQNLTHGMYQYCFVNYNK